MARESVSPAEIAPPPAAEREARDADPAAERREGLEPSSTASPDGSEVPSPREAGEREEPRADHERDRVETQDGRAEADWDDVLERLARVDRDLDAFVARPDDDDDGFAATSTKSPRAISADADAIFAVTDAAPTETSLNEFEFGREHHLPDVPEPLAVPAESRVEFDDGARESTDSEREPERIESVISRGFVARLAARMTSSLERDKSSSSASETIRRERAEAVAAVEAFYDALMERREKRIPRGDEITTNRRDAPLRSPRQELPFVKKTELRGDGVAELRRLLETL